MSRRPEKPAHITQEDWDSVDVPELTDEEWARAMPFKQALPDAAKSLNRPMHPGSFIRTEIIQGRALSVSQAAEALRVLRPTLSAVLNGRASLSPEMALRLEKAFGLSMDTLMRMQCEYDIVQARQREAEIDVPPYEGSIKPGSQGSLL